MSDRSRHPEAHDRAALEAYLRDEGVPDEQIRSAQDFHELTLLAWRRIFHLAGKELDVEDAARIAGLEPDQIDRAYRALGLPGRGVGAAGIALTDADIEVLRLLGDMAKLLGEDEVFHMCRVIGSSLARIAEATVTSTRLNYEIPALQETSYVDFVRTMEVILEDALPRLAHALDRILRYHMIRASDQAWMVTPEGSATTLELAVGFADMVGFTERSAELSHSEVAQIIDRFEGSVTDTVAALGGRAVKFIGDEVMFTFADLSAACLYSLQLVELAEDEAIPDIRVGLAYGEVITRYGDYYGPVVNVASRLVQIAPSGVVLVSKDVAERVEGSVGIEKQVPKRVKGVDEPLEHYRLLPE